MSSGNNEYEKKIMTYKFYITFLILLNTLAFSIIKETAAVKILNITFKKLFLYNF